MAVAATRLPEPFPADPADPADRFLVAQARELAVTYSARIERSATIPMGRVCGEAHRPVESCGGEHLGRQALRQGQARLNRPDQHPNPCCADHPQSP